MGSAAILRGRENPRLGACPGILGNFLQDRIGLVSRSQAAVLSASESPEPIVWRTSSRGRTAITPRLRKCRHRGRPWDRAAAHRAVEISSVAWRDSHISASRSLSSPSRRRTSVLERDTLRANWGSECQPACWRARSFLRTASGSSAKANRSLASR
jgi:hypothetical protein